MNSQCATPPAVFADTVIRAADLGKMYYLFNRPQDRLKQAFLWGRKKLYHEFWALHNVSFELRRGEALGIVGRNGSGKSTLLQLIAGVLRPTTGRIEISGKVAALLELGSGFNPDYSGRENVFLNGAILGLSRAQIENRFDQIAAFADIGQFLDQPVKTYSSGMFVRLAFAVTTCVDAEILLIDEALAVGDVFFRQKCYKRLQELRESGVSIILVSHATTEVEQFCQRGLVLHRGRLKFAGSAVEAVRRYYLLEQEDRLEAAAADGTLAPPPLPSGDCGYGQIAWPREADLDISGVAQIGNGWARCTGVALTDTEDRPCLGFVQGQTARFYYEFELLADVEVPVGGIVLTNDRGVCVHGKNTLQHDTPVPRSVAKGQRLRFCQEIKLELEVREYTFEVGLTMLRREDFDRRAAFSHQELWTRELRVCHLAQVAQFSVDFRSGGSPVQLVSHGVANLPGGCRMTVVGGAA